MANHLDELRAMLRQRLEECQGAIRAHEADVARGDRDENAAYCAALQADVDSLLSSARSIRAAMDESLREDLTNSDIDLLLSLAKQQAFTAHAEPRGWKWSETAEQWTAPDQRVFDKFGSRVR